MQYPVTPAVRFLRDKSIDFEPFLYDYVEKGGTAESARQLGVDEHTIIKTLVFETSENKPLIVLMHGDRQVSTKEMARHLGVKGVAPAAAEKALKLTGYMVGGTSPFGLRSDIPVYCEGSILNMERIFINGGKRGFLVRVDPRKSLQEALGAAVVEVAIDR